MIGIILAGGESRRFGEDKATYLDPVQNKAWIQIMVEKMSQLPLSQIYIASSYKNQTFIQNICVDLIPKENVIIDREPYIQIGPLGGLYSVSKKVGKFAEYLVLPTDYPQLSIQTLHILSHSNKNCYAKDIHDCSHYTVAHISFTPEEITHSLSTGNRRLLYFFQEIGASPFLISNNDLHNCNEKNSLFFDR